MKLRLDQYGYSGIFNALPVGGQPDVSFREDTARNRKDNGPANIAILRCRALDLARRDTSKGSILMKLKRAGAEVFSKVSR